MAKKEKFRAKTILGNNYQAEGNQNIGNKNRTLFIIPLLIIMGAASFVLFTSFTRGDSKNIQELPSQEQAK